MCVCVCVCVCVYVHVHVKHREETDRILDFMYILLYILCTGLILFMLLMNEGYFKAVQCTIVLLF